MPNNFFFEDSRLITSAEIIFVFFIKYAGTVSSKII